MLVASNTSSIEDLDTCDSIFRSRYKIKVVVFSFNKYTVSLRGVEWRKLTKLKIRINMKNVLRDK